MPGLLAQNSEQAMTRPKALKGRRREMILERVRDPLVFEAFLLASRDLQTELARQWQTEAVRRWNDAFAAVLALKRPAPAPGGAPRAEAEGEGSSVKAPDSPESSGGTGP